MENEGEESKPTEREFACPLLPLVCLDEKAEHNHSHPITPPFQFERPYLILGEPAMKPNEHSPTGRVGHFILFDLGSGKAIPGMWHADRFRLVTEDDNFF